VRLPDRTKESSHLGCEFVLSIGPDFQGSDYFRIAIAQEVRLANHRVLVVEDDPAGQQLTRVLLERAGYYVEVAGAASIALQRAADSLPALILVDLGLPGWDGLWLSRELKRRPETAEIPIVAVSGRVSLHDREAAHRAGCIGFISKPIDTRTFASRVAAYISGPRVA
jgi:CheY-like chemotaxis protein